MPPDCVGRPGQRCQSQRWSTFICNPVKGLVVTGITAEVTRKAKAMLARVQRLIEHLTQWAPQWASRPMKTTTRSLGFALTILREYLTLPLSTGLTP